LKKFLKKINDLLNGGQKKELIILSFLLLVGAIFEFMSIGVLAPVINIIIEGQSTTLNILLSYLNITNLNQESVTLILLLLVILIYLFKILFLYKLAQKNYTFLNFLSANLSLKLYKKYIYNAYDFHIKNNSAFLIKNITNEVSSLRSLLEGLILAIIESFMLTSILILIIYVEPIGAFVVIAFFLVFSTLFYNIYKARIEFWGKLRENLDNKILRKVIETFDGIQEIKIYNKEELFYKSYSFVNERRAEVMTKNDVVGQVPKLFLEFVTIASLLSFVYYMFLNDFETNKIIFTLGIYAAASIKLIPSINKLIYSIQRIKFNMPALDIIHKQIIDIESNSLSKESYSKRSIFNKISFNKISFQYNKEKIILDKVDFNIGYGRVIGIIGESGAGKTTFVNILSGLLRPTEGEILIKDVDNNKLSFKNIIGYVPQSTFLMDTTIKENICFGNNIDNKKYDLIIEQSQLKSFINELKDGDSTIVGEKGIKISGGQRQRISIARALYNDSQLIIFDEPTSALDSKTQEDLINSLIELKGQKTIVIISHTKSVMEKCDEIYEISNSKIRRINE
jgi:ATP-binding cassette, subfamily B, bacterial PglK